MKKQSSIFTESYWRGVKKIESQEACPESHIVDQYEEYWKYPQKGKKTIGCCKGFPSGMETLIGDKALPNAVSFDPVSKIRAVDCLV